MDKKIDYGQFTPETFDFDKWPEPVKMAYCNTISQGDQMHPNEFYQGREALLVINGVQFSFSQFAERFNWCLDQEIEQAARNIAEKRLKMLTITERIAKLESVIQTELDQLFPGTHSEPDM